VHFLAYTENGVQLPHPAWLDTGAMSMRITHLLVILGIALLVFGPKKLPELGKELGEGIRGFKSAMKEPQEVSDKITIADHASSPR
jgi:sec-independent protein translocase protein TatA